MKISQLVEWLDARLDADAFAPADPSLNGLQVGDGTRNVNLIALAVDASLATFTAAAKAGADAILVHHGLFWGKPIAVTGPHYERISVLLSKNIGLCAYHLPLDAHPTVGNNAVIASLLDMDLQTREPFGMFHGRYIGYCGMLKTPLSVSEIAQRLQFTVEQGLKVLAYGPEKISRVGIVSGGAAEDIYDAIDLKLDAFITGEVAHETYHPVREAGITMICGGHYATEVFGVQALGQLITKELGIPTVFVDIPTSL